MSYIEMLNELKSKGLQVREKGGKVYLINNGKEIDYSEQEWDCLSIKGRIIELAAIIKYFEC